MPDFVLWETCRCCTHFTQCNEPFASSGVCPHPTEAHQGDVHPFVFQPMASYRYARLLHRDARVSSIFHCWRRGKPPHNEDYLYLRSLAYDAEPSDEAAYFLITDILNEVCTHWAADVLVYYFDVHDTSPNFSVRSAEVLEIVNAAISMAILQHGRASVEAYADLTLGADWTRLLIDQMRLLTWSVLQFQHLDFSGLTDEDFRVRFEEEWSRLLHFPDLFYGFRVLPRLGLNDFVRYSLLPRGDANIRGQISNYLMHQWGEYPHLGQLLSPLFADVAFGKRLKAIYRPLVEKVVREALHNSQVLSGDERIRADIEIQVWKVFEAAMKKFRFYGPRQRKRLWGKIGIIGLPQTPELRRYFDEGLKKRGLRNEGNPLTLSDVSEVGFAHYIDLKLKAWLGRNYPPEPAPREVVGNFFVDSGVKRAQGQSAPANTGEAFLGLDGLPYVQRRAAAQFYGVTEDQLRNWDRDGSLPARRAEQVLALPLPPSLRLEHRLYPQTAQAQKGVGELKLRKATRSTRAAQGECTRKIAARHVGVPATTLLGWESKGWLEPQKRGNSVIYSTQDLERAFALKKERLQKSN